MGFVVPTPQVPSRTEASHSGPWYKAETRLHTQHHCDSTLTLGAQSALPPKGASRPLGMQMAFGTRPRRALDAARRSPGQGGEPPSNIAVLHHSWPPSIRLGVH